MPSLFDEVPWWTTADLNNALSRERDRKLPVRPSFFNALVPQVSAQDAAMNRPAPVERASLFPLATYPDGSTKLALPGMIAEDIPRAFTAPARAFRGEIPGEDMISEGLNFAGNMAIGGSVVPKPANTAGMFGGRLAKTADHAKLATAEKMAAKGAPREDIWSQTGWFKGVDGKWRFEIDDGGAVAQGVETSKTVGDALHHPELYNAYPGTERVKFKPEYSGGGEYHNGNMFVGPRMTAAPYDTSTMLHEAQHRIQQLEGFTKGSSPTYESIMQMYGDGILGKARLAKDLIKNRGDIEVTGDAADAAFSAYTRNAGEVESRAVETRMGLSPEERASRPPWLDYDVPESQQIVRLGANTTEASAPGVVVAEAARQPRPVQMEVPFYRGSGHGQTSVDYSQPYWGTSDKGLASDYAKSRSRTYFDAEATPNVTPAVARFRNPLHIDAQNAGWSEVPFEGQKWNTDKLAETAKQRGHDGLVIDRLYDEGRWNPDEGLPSTVAALRPGTVSSAFDPNNILYQNAKNAAPAGVLISNAGDQAPRVGDDPLIELLRRYGVTR